MKRLLILLLLVTLAPMIQAQDENKIETPVLSGPYAVGRLTLQWVDETRDEVFTPPTDDKRTLVVTVFYPAEPDKSAEPAVYLPTEQMDEIGIKTGLHRVILERLPVQSYESPPAAESETGFPVLVFSPEFGMVPVYYTTLLEDLASQGYVIVSLSHPYSTALTYFLDGEVAEINAAGSLWPQNENDMDSRREQLYEVWSADTRFALDRMVLVNAAHLILAGKLDMTRVGVIGHGFGGTTSMIAAIEDSRIQAGVLMNAQIPDIARPDGPEQPFLYLLADALMYTDEQLESYGLTREDFEASEALNVAERGGLMNQGYLVQIREATHMGFMTDWLFFAVEFPTVVTEDFVGPAYGPRTFEVIRSYTTAYFDQQLRGAESPLLDGPSDDFPEAMFTLLPMPSD